MEIAQSAGAARELLTSGADADTVEDAVIATLISRAMEVATQDKITPSLYREVVGLVVRLREQKKSAWNASASNAPASRSTSPTSS